LPGLPHTPRAIRGDIRLKIIVRVAIVQVHIPSVVGVGRDRSGRPKIVTSRRFISAILPRLNQS